MNLNITEILQKKYTTTINQQLTLFAIIKRFPSIILRFASSLMHAGVSMLVAES